MKNIIKEEDKLRLRKAGYLLIGPSQHSAVKICLWTKRSLTDAGYCYKQKFYGINSHRCLQFTPALPFCSNKCLHCWRDTKITFPKWIGEIDSPKEILDAAIEGQRKLLNGFPGNPETNLRKWREAQNPNQAAISLAGEPTLYPLLPELLNELKKRKFTSFLVTNGLLPQAIELLQEKKALPTQLYLSLNSFNSGNYLKMHNPLKKNSWKKFRQSLELLKELDTRTVLRMTLLKGLNLSNPRDYAKLILESQCDYVECKAYMAVGYSRERLGLDFMPSFKEITDFAKELALETGYLLSENHEESRVVLLCKGRKEEKKRILSNHKTT